MQGKPAPVHFSFYQKRTPRQQCIPTCHPQREGETEDIRTVQDRRAAQNFAKIRSVIDTTIKNGQNVLGGYHQLLYLIVKLN